MNTQPKYPPELRERAIRMVYEQREYHESQWAAIESVAQKIGCTAQTLRNWIAKAGRRAGADDAASAPRVKELEREVRELKRAKVIIESWRKHYNAVRPHSSLEYHTPLEFVSQWKSESTTGARVSR